MEKPATRTQKKGGDVKPKPKPAISAGSPASLKTLTPTELQTVPSPELWAVMSALSPLDDERDEYANDTGLVSWERMDQLMKTAEYSAKGGL